VSSPGRPTAASARRAALSDADRCAGRLAEGATSAMSPIFRSPGSSSRTSPRCSPTSSLLERDRPDVVAFGRGNIDKVCGIEARGFILASPVAYQQGPGSSPSASRGSCPRHGGGELRPGVRRGDAGGHSDAVDPATGPDRRRRDRHRRDRRAAARLVERLAAPSPASRVSSSSSSSGRKRWTLRPSPWCATPDNG